MTWSVENGVVVVVAGEQEKAALLFDKTAVRRWEKEMAHLIAEHLAW